MVPIWHGEVDRPATPSVEPRGRRGVASPGVERVRIGRSRFSAEFYSPQDPRGAVVLAHGQPATPGPRERFVADVLNTYRLATLGLDMAGAVAAGGSLSAAELDAACRRIVQALDWLTRRREPAHAHLGLLGAGAAAAAVLRIAAERPAQIGAAVICGGHVAQAVECLPHVHAPVLLIVGAKDRDTLRVNRDALAALPGAKRLEVVPDAAHGFEEPGTLEAAAHLAGAWLAAHLQPAGRHW
jgi:dienelactone hydrolase